MFEASYFNKLATVNFVVGGSNTAQDVVAASLFRPITLHQLLRVILGTPVWHAAQNLDAP